MYFNSFSFIIIYPIIFMMYYLIPAQWLRIRNIYLVLVSYALYICWNPSFCAILFCITVLSYFAALILRNNEKRRKYIVFWGIFLILLPLIIIKYSDFLNEIIESLVIIWGVKWELKGLNWIIPIGLSFYTLQAISYLCDVYQKRIEAERDIVAFALFLSFFPTITMGPIARAGDMLPQFKKNKKYFDYEKSVDGLKLLLWGMFLKVAVADRTGLYVDAVMDNYQTYSGSSCFVASCMYSVQIYTDFAGYSLIACGIGKLLGFDIVQNFRRPFFAHSVSDYWTRWHISLSTWLRDYIYIPLGGSREGKIRTYRNIFITFLVSGLWHGANWTYILWGIWHAVCVMVERAINQQRCRYTGGGKLVKILIAFLLVNFSRILFHSSTLADAYGIMSKIFCSFSLENIFLPTYQTISISIFVLANDAIKEFYPHFSHAMNSKHTLIRWTTYVLLLVLILTEGVLDSGRFIYANF